MEVENKSSVNRLKKEFYKKVKEKYNVRQQECFDLFDDVIETIADSILENEETKIRGFGTFKVNERYVDKPKTIFLNNSEVKISNKKAVLFVPSIAITQKLNRKDDEEDNC